MDLRRAITARANLVTATVRGQRAPGMSDAKYLGGHPPGWPFSGCNPSRFRPYPRWPPPADVLAAIRASSEHSPGSERFVYHGHGPSAADLAPKLRRALSAIDAIGGVGSIAPARFTSALQHALSPMRISERDAKRISYTLRTRSGPAEMRQKGPHGVPPILFEAVHARLSLDALADATALQREGLRAELAQRDNSYYWIWT